MIIQYMQCKDIHDRIAVLKAKASMIWQQLDLALQRAEITKEFSHVDLLEKEFKDIRN